MSPLTWAAVQVTNPRTVGLILVANAIARAVVLLVGGVLVDRLGPKRLVVGSDAARTLVMILAAAWLVTRAPDVGMLVALAVVFGLVDGLFLPAVGALPVYLAPTSAMTRLQALKTVVTRGAMFAGAPLGAWIILTGSVRLAFVLNAALFALSVLALLMTKVLPRDRSDDRRPAAGGRRPGEDAPELAVPTAAPAAVSRWWQDWRRELHDGLRVVAAHPTLRTLVILVAVLDFGFAGPITVGVPLVAAEYGWGVQGIGWLLGGFGIGAAAAAGYFALRPATRRTGPLALAGLLLMGTSLGSVGVLAQFGLRPDAAVVVAGFAGLFTGLGAGIFGTLANATLVTLAPEAKVGLVMAVVVLAGDTAMPLSLAATGWVTEATNAAVPFILGGLVMLSGAGYALAGPHVRAIRLAESGAARFGPVMAWLRAQVGVGHPAATFLPSTQQLVSWVGEAGDAAGAGELAVAEGF